jgi:enterochelin esterase family protein
MTHRLRDLLVLGAALAATALPPLAPRAVRAATPGPSRVEVRTLRSERFGRERRVWVVTPPGTAAGRATPLDLLVVLDGEQYLEEIPLPAMLDSLRTADRLPAFLAVLVDDSTGAARIDDLGNRARFAEFLAGELVPWVRARWHVTQDPHRVIVAGSSAGGLAAAHAALQRPDVFGNVLSQSGAFWRGPEGSNSPPFEWLAGRVAAGPKRDVRFFLDVGELETHRVLGTGPAFIEAHRRFRDALRAKGYALSGTEVPGGQHAPEFWAKRLPTALVTLAGGW